MKRFLAAFFFLLFPLQALAAATIDVDPSDLTYHYLDFLRGHGLIHSDIEGQRPFSREEVARLILEAQQRWDSQDSNSSSTKGTSPVNQVLEILEKSYQAEIQVYQDPSARKGIHLTPLRDASTLFTYLHGDPKKFPVDNGIGLINASSQPLVENREGRHYVNGAQYSIETGHSLDVTSYSSFYFRPRFQVQYSFKNQDPKVNGYVQGLYGNIVFHNIKLQGGRSTILEGQGPHGGLLLSDNARPLDHVLISNDHPFRFPWIFKYLGDVKMMAFYSNLGPEYNFRYSSLAGYKVTIKPFSVWELGMSNVMHFGGSGAPHFNAWDFIGDFAGFSGTSNSTSNRLFGFDTRLRFPFLRNSELYGEFILDDRSVSHIKKTLLDLSGYYGGIWIPRLNESGSLHARLEGRYLSKVFYRHSQFISGHTLNGQILGDPLGPDGQSFHASVGYDLNPYRILDFSFTYERSDSNFYSPSPGRFIALTNNPAEQRLRWMASGAFTFPKSRLTLESRLGYERVNNFNYRSGEDQNGLLVEGGVTWNVGTIPTSGVLYTD